MPTKKPEARLPKGPPKDKAEMTDAERLKDWRERRAKAGPVGSQTKNEKLGIK